VKTTFLSTHPKIRHWLHFLCGAVAGFAIVEDPHSGWAIILGFHGYEAWEDFGYLHDSSFKDIWEFWVAFTPVVVTMIALRLGGI